MARILVVDDARFVRTWCRETLTRGGHEVIEATNGEEAIAAYQAQRPDLVLLDIVMPGMDGLTALRELHRIDAGARVAILTTEGQAGTTDEAHQAGARAFVTKPGTAKALLAAVDQALA
jgi:two-component system chemotaxis response regulator CheY